MFFNLLKNVLGSWKNFLSYWIPSQYETLPFLGPKQALTIIRSWYHFSSFSHLIASLFPFQSYSFNVGRLNPQISLSPTNASISLHLPPILPFSYSCCPKSRYTGDLLTSAYDSAKCSLPFLDTQPHGKNQIYSAKIAPPTLYLTHLFNSNILPPQVPAWSLI